jgi:hypothetical protein
VNVTPSNGASKSCGCLKKEKMAERARSQVTHGRTKTVEYQAYRDARDRCQKPNHPSYACYGGRGIKFLYKSFEEFFAIDYNTIRYRLRYGWSAEDALTRPSRSSKRRRGRTAQDREFGQPAK